MPLKWLGVIKLEEMLVKPQNILQKLSFINIEPIIKEMIYVVVNEQFERGDACVSD